jgi:FkbM family methyltransferase
VKRALLKLFYPIGNPAKIRFGSLKGYKIQITENSGWSPIVGRWEPINQIVFSNIIKPDQIVYDLGSNNGLHSLLFSKLVGPNGKVIAFEPLDTNVSEIKQNIRLNGITNIEIVPKAVSNKSGEISFLLGQHDKQGSLVGIGRESQNSIKIQCISIDDYIRDTNQNPDFIKIDVEGAESMVLEGASELLKNKPKLFIELHTPEQDVAVGQILKEFGYEVYRINENQKPGSDKGEYLEKVSNLEVGWPNPDGIWGNIIAF